MMGRHGKRKINKGIRRNKGERGMELKNTEEMGGMRSKQEKQREIRRVGKGERKMK